MKRLLSILIVMLLLLSLASCENISDDNSTASSESSESVESSESGKSSETSNDFETSLGGGSATNRDENNEDENNEDESLGDFDDENQEFEESNDPENDESEPEDDSESSTPEDDNSSNEECSHKSTKTVNAKEATCKSTGYSGDKVCKTCGETVEKGEVIKKTNVHKSTVVKNEVAATYDKEGYTGDTVCTVCNTTVSYGQKIPKLPSDEILTPAVLSAIEEGFIKLINQERTSHGLNALAIDPHLDNCAQKRSEEIISYFSHTRPDGSECFSLIDSSKFNWRRLGENIGQTSHVANESFYPSESKFTPTQENIAKVYTKMFEGFKNSPGHYENIMTPEFTHMGVGLSYKESQWEGIPYFYFGHFFGQIKN